jgi:hypothetical protein
MITYKFPDDFKIEKLRGVVATGGKFCRHDGKWQERDNAVRFDLKIDGRRLVALCAGKPELEKLLAEHLANQDAQKAEKERLIKEFNATPAGIYKMLDDAVSNSYDPDDFPGSKNWKIHHAAQQKLEEFEAANPELVESVRQSRRATDDAAYDALSDFVKNGS